MMGAPRQPLNPATQSVGFTAKLVTVRSISADGRQAVCVDRQNVQTTVTMMVQRSKAVLPAVGETWLLTQDLGMWSFAAIVANSAGQFAGFSVVSGATAGQVTVSAAAPAAPSAGDLWISGAAGNEMFQWSGTAWVPVQAGTQAIADGAVTAAKIAPGTLTASQLAPAAGITAGQVAFRATDIGGTQVITGTSQPVAPTPGTVWINPAQGNAVMVWNGGAWVAAQFGAQAIAPGSLTATQIAANAGITAQQVAFSVTDIGGTKITFSATPPASPNPGDLWYDSGHGYRLSQWSGSAWAPYQFGTQAIAAGSVTAALIAANTITAAQIAAGTITGNEIKAGVSLQTPVIIGTDFLITPGGAFFYTGSPAPGNLSVSVVPGSSQVTDPVGNVALAGSTVYLSQSGKQLAVSSGQPYGSGGTAVYLAATQAGPWTISSALLSFSVSGSGTDVNVALEGNLVSVAGSLGTSFPVGPVSIGPVQPAVVAADPTFGGGDVSETWHKPSSLTHGWAQGSPAFQYQLTATGRLAIAGLINSAAMTTADFYTLPNSAYWPAQGLDFPVNFHSATGYTQAAFGRISNSGVLSIINSSTSTGIVVLCSEIPLDLT